MKPCDCKDAQYLKKLNESGICFNDDWIEVIPSFIKLNMGHTQIRISMHRFKQFAQWYLQDQEKDREKP